MFPSPFPHIALIFLLAINVTPLKHKAKTVTTLLDAKWEVTPLVLEVSEYIAEESIDDFWSFVDEISSLKPELVELNSDVKQYNKVLEVAGNYLSVLQVKALKLALSLHIFSPKIEMYGQMASQRGLPQSRCPAAVDYDGKLYCHEEDFKSQFRKTEALPKRIETYRIDHHYPASENKSKIAVLYGELGTVEFSRMHHVLREYAKQGELDYVLRHYVKERPNKRVRLSGYGVELQMKSTEYKVMDDTQVKSDTRINNTENEDPDEEIEGLNFFKLKSLRPDLKEKLEKFRSHLLETSNEMAPLKVWQVQELSLQAAERILGCSSGEEALRTLTHISHNLPLQARSLIRTPVRPALKKEILSNQELFGKTLNLSPSDAAIFINGMFFDVEIVDVITLLEVLRQELRIMEKLHKIGIREEEMKELLALDLTTSSSEYAIDIRDSAIQWINDIEYDSQYHMWSDSLLDLLRPTFPGMLRSIRRNLYNLVLIVDPTKKEAKQLLKFMESFYIHTAPLRLGIVFGVTADTKKNGLNDAGIAILNAFNYISEVKNAYHGLSFITDVYASVAENRDINTKDVHKKFKDKYANADFNDIFGEDSNYDTGRKLSVEFIKRSGLRKMPQALLNGIPLSEKKLNADDFEEAVLNEIMSQTPQLQKAVFRGEFSDTDNAIEYLMSKPNVMPRLNERVLSDNAVYLDLTGNPSETFEAKNFGNLRSKDKIATLSNRMKYFTLKSGPNDKPTLITHWVITDLDVQKGRDLLRFALEQMTNSAYIRVGVIVNPRDSHVTPLTQLILTSLQVLMPHVATSYVLKTLQNEEVFEALDGFRRPPNFNLEGLDIEALSVALKEGSWIQNLIEIHRSFVKSAVKFKPGEHGIITNGRIFGPFEEDEVFVVDDFSLIDRFCFNSYGDKILSVFKKDKSTSAAGENVKAQSYITSDMLMKTVSVLTFRTDMRSRFEIPIKEKDKGLSFVSIPPVDPSLPAFDIAAIVDPVSRGAQKIGPILSVLHQATNSHIRLFLNCVEKNSDLPLKSFYKYVLEPELQFLSNGQLSPGPIAKFTNLPTSVLFTQAMHVPENWLVESVRSPYDLDNIKLDDVLESTIHSLSRGQKLLSVKNFKELRRNTA
ncbi:UNVERIFIED_CONTAM: hypothetical protein PYX00_002578 [Menopon gallinae]|uniref:UDP-glucose:glycoprotein glucosyltransferase n=1 Tax=Menopon gallinae TaxID=328185 RepID=A0AAW2IIU6_9NEOP